MRTLDKELKMEALTIIKESGSVTETRRKLIKLEKQILIEASLVGGDGMIRRIMELTSHKM